MDITLVKKGVSGDIDPLIVMIDSEEDSPAFTQKINVGETITVADETGYRIMSQYRGLFELAKKDDNYKTKTMKAGV